MNLTQKEKNLAALCSDLEQHCRSQLDIDPLPEPAPIAKSLYLAHSTSSRSLAEIQKGGFLLSQAAIYAQKRKSLPADNAESLLGTTGFVFFYAGRFRYPQTTCGLLFTRSLEENHRDDGEASPFDSGGLVHHIQRPDPAEPPRAFLERHTLPLPGHRHYLGLCLSTLFAAPENYFDDAPPGNPGPLGLTGGDARRWTHEVRIPERVHLRGPHLQAVFIPVSFAGPNSAIAGLLSWCLDEHVDVVAFHTEDLESFDALNRNCLDYLRTKLQ